MIVGKGKKRTDFAGGKATQDVLDAMLGTTGNLRAPVVRVGKTLLVGYNEEAYGEVLG